MKHNFPQLEKKILRFWQQEKIFEKSIKARPGSRQFVFYEGPPTANAKPGLHHVLARVFKDIICRYKTMQGFRVERKAGWDTHGLPVELEIEKKLGLKSKKDIEKYGIIPFNKKCQQSVWQYKKDWEKLTERIAFWLDMENPYVTYTPDYIETVWWIIKQIWQKGLLVQDYKVVPWCPRCGTALSSHEVAQGYKKVREKSIYVKFRIKNQESPKESLRLPTGQARIKNVIVWTTTPWTLPANVALAVHPKGKYKDWIGLEYEPLYPNEGPHRIVGADFVSEEEGTGIVHIAPAYGEDDLELAKKEGLPIVHTVDEQGRYKGKFIKDADKEIIADLKKQGLLEKTEWIEHDYPFCWRCQSPLIYYARQTWFIKMTALRDKLLKNNQKINWVPKYLKEGRFGEWLREIKDWALSRERYWGTPLPIWQCQCDNIKVIESIKEIEKLSGKKVRDPHRPYIDKITFKCEKCGGKMKRVPEVIDCWFDSGAMPFAQAHWPFNKKEFLFPADYISEAIDQTRGWFYTLLAISTLLGFGPAYKNVISLGHVLDEKGEKMSKSKGNVVDPGQVIEKYGADTIRWYFYTLNQPGDSKLFAFRDVEDCFKRFIMTFWNCYTFFKTYLPQKCFRILRSEYSETGIKSQTLLDKWVISKLNKLILDVTSSLDNYDVTRAARSIEDFVINDLSLWYIRRSRKRFQRPETDKKLKNASNILGFVLLTISKLGAPFIPFLSENIYQRVSGATLRGVRFASSKFQVSRSLHLEDWPKANKRLIDESLDKNMEKTRELVNLALAERAKLKIRVRQPLSKLKVKSAKFKINKDLLDLVKEEVNVKEIIFDSKIKKEIELDAKITPELKEEGIMREVVRYIRAMRKQLGLKPKDKILVRYSCSPKLAKILAKIKTEDIKPKKTEKKFDLEKQVKIDGEKLCLHIIVLKG